VNVQWLELALTLAAAAAFLLASLNCLYLAGYAQSARSRARRAGAAALTAVEAGVALEALLFLSQAPAPPSWTRAAATAVVRATNLVASAMVSVLLWRAADRTSR
jgi:hypothetical protein